MNLKQKILTLLEQPRTITQLYVALSSSADAEGITQLSNGELADALIDLCVSEKVKRDDITGPDVFGMCHVLYEVRR